MSIAEEKRIQDPKRQRNHRLTIALPIRVNEAELCLEDARGRCLVTSSLGDFTEGQDLKILREICEAMNGRQMVAEGVGA